MTADMPKKGLNFSKGECWPIRLNVRFATKPNFAPVAEASPPVATKSTFGGPESSYESI